MQVLCHGRRRSDTVAPRLADHGHARFGLRKFSFCSFFTAFSFLTLTKTHSQQGLDVHGAMAEPTETETTASMPPEDSSDTAKASPVKKDVVMKETEEISAENETNEEPKTEAPSNTNNDAILAQSKKDEAEPAASTTKQDAEMNDAEENSSPNKETNEVDETEDRKPAATTKLPPRPIKKARTAYFIFADEKRAEIAARVSTYVCCRVLWRLFLRGVCFILLVLTPHTLNLCSFLFVRTTVAPW